MPSHGLNGFARESLSDFNLAKFSVWVLMASEVFAAGASSTGFTSSTVATFGAPGFITFEPGAFSGTIGLCVNVFSWEIGRVVSPEINSVFF